MNAFTNKFINYCEEELELQYNLIEIKRTDPNDGFYKSLPVCIIDAVFSIGIKYEIVKNVEKSFFESLKFTDPHTNLTQPREFSVNDFISHLENNMTADGKVDFEKIADEIFKNRNRTSSTNGILKAEACYLVATVFQKHKINTLNDFATYENKHDLDKEICNVKGQSSGVMLKYLYMLAGDKDTVKPDRHLVNFITRLDSSIAKNDHKKITNIIIEAVDGLKTKYPTLTPRFLDFLIWEYMRAPKVWLLSIVRNDGSAPILRAYESFEDVKNAVNTLYSDQITNEQNYAISVGGKTFITLKKTAVEPPLKN